MSKTKEKRMRNLLSAILVIMSLVCFGAVGFAQESKDINLKNIGFTDMSLESKHNDIRALFRNMNKYTTRHQLDKIMNMYSDDYVNFDGVDKKKLTQNLKEAWIAYPNVKYKQKILFLDAGVDFAKVVTLETVKGDTTMSVDYLPGYGYIDAEAILVYHLKKVAGEWKIYSDSTIHEQSSLKYGIAKDIKMSIDAPGKAYAGFEYTASARVDVPKEYVAMVSINNEMIKFPMGKPEDAFRTIKADTVQERILRANKEDKNENAFASIGIAEASVNENDVNIKIKGIAILSKRVNILKKVTQPESDVKKNETI